MKVRISFLLSSIFLCCSTAWAQTSVGLLGIDSSFDYHGPTPGQYEHDFHGYDDSGTCYSAGVPIFGGFQRWVAAGRVGAANDSARLGIVCFDTSGTPILNFGNHGTAELSWGASDYANCLLLLHDSSILCSGASDGEPALYHITVHGLPDLLFGDSGHVVFRPFSKTAGVFTGLDSTPIRPPNGTVQQKFYYVATGYAPPRPAILESEPGFVAVRLDSDLTIDSSFGQNGQVFIPAPITFAKGFLAPQGPILFAGLDTAHDPEIVLCRLKENGIPDSSFGIDGILHTQIHLHGKAALRRLIVYGNFDSTLLVEGPMLDSSAGAPVTFLQFLYDGSLDPKFGSHGLATPALDTSFEPHGIVEANDGSILLSGSAGTALKKGAVMKLFGTGAIDSLKRSLEGTLDTNFGIKGIEYLAAGTSTEENYLAAFVPIGRRAIMDTMRISRFLGIGSIRNSAGNFDYLVVRYIRVLVPSRVENTSPGTLTVEVFPNPAQTVLSLSSADPIEEVRIADERGRFIQSLHPAGPVNEYSFDVSGLAAGTYSLIVIGPNGTSVQRLAIVR